MAKPTKPTQNIVTWDSTTNTKTLPPVALQTSGYASLDTPQFDNFNYIFNSSGAWHTYAEDVADDVYGKIGLDDTTTINFDEVGTVDTDAYSNYINSHLPDPVGATFASSIKGESASDPAERNLINGHSNQMEGRIIDTIVNGTNVTTTLGAAEYISGSIINGFNSNIDAVCANSIVNGNRHDIADDITSVIVNGEYAKPYANSNCYLLGTNANSVNTAGAFQSVDRLEAIDQDTGADTASWVVNGSGQHGIFKAECVYVETALAGSTQPYIVMSEGTFDPNGNVTITNTSSDTATAAGFTVTTGTGTFQIDKNATPNAGYWLGKITTIECTN